MSKNSYVLIALLVIFTIVVFVLSGFLGKRIKIISGTISKVSNKMASDGNCEVLVDDQRIIIQSSGDKMRSYIPKLRGIIVGISCLNAATDLTPYVGKNVSALGSWDGYDLTVEGSLLYYIWVR